MKGECYYLWKAKKESVFFKNTCRYGLSSVGLLLTLVLIFAFQGNTILENPLHIVLIAVPLVLQTFFVFAIVYSKEKPICPLEDMSISCRKHCVWPPGTRKCTVRRDIPGSTAFVPSVAGLIIAGEVVNDLISFERDVRWQHWRSWGRTDHFHQNERMWACSECAEKHQRGRTPNFEINR